MRVALVHDHLVQDGGAERVLAAMHRLWPEAPTYTLVYDRKAMGSFANAGDVRTSFLSRFPGATRGYRWFLPLMPAATESYDLRGYDVVISSSSAFAKGVITAPGTLHLCYCHTPTRYLWSQTHDYVDDATPRGIRSIMPLVINALRTWDQLAAARVDRFIANSSTVAARIKKFYRRDAAVVHPPVDTTKMKIAPRAEETYFVAGGRLVAYKRFDLLVAAFNALGAPLVIFGDGPELRSLQRMAWSNVRFVGRVSDEEKARLYAGAVAYLHPQEEDFGITLVEAMACGTPVIAYRGGGACETMQEGVTGVFFNEQSVSAITAAVRSFRTENFSREAIREHALQFDQARFSENFGTLVAKAYEEWVCASPTTFVHS